MQKLILLIVVMFFPALIGQAFGKNLAPADLTPYLNCSLSNDQTASHIVAGKKLSYRSSSEIGYDKRSWEERVAGSWNLLSKKMLGSSGYNVANDRITDIQELAFRSRFEPSSRLVVVHLATSNILKRD